VNAFRFDGLRFAIDEDGSLLSRDRRSIAESARKKGGNDGEGPMSLHRSSPFLALHCANRLNARTGSLFPISGLKQRMALADACPMASGAEGPDAHGY
jgi:hypothetical protein